MWAIIGILFILVGVYVILNMPSSVPKPETESGAEKQAEPAAKEESEEEQKKAQEEKQKDRAGMLSKIIVPGNMPPVRVYFGSQTGTAEKFSGVLDEEAGILNIEDCKVIDFNDFKEEEFTQHPLVIVIVATHYEGDPCDNTRNFYKWFKKIIKNKTQKPFTGMNFAVFGLGDTSYEQYNEMGKVFDENFEKLGGKRLHEMACGNAETFSTEDDFNKWKEDLWTKIVAEYASKQTSVQKKKALVRRQSSFNNIVDPNVMPFIVDMSDLQLQEGDVEAPEYDMNGRNFLASKALPIKSIRELRQKNIEGGSTLEVIYDLRGTGLTYKTAANAAIYATNKPADVEKFAQMFNLDLDQKFCFRKNPGFNSRRKTKTPFPVTDASGMTIREALTKHINLTNPIQKKILGLMIPFCEAEADKKLLEEVSKSGPENKYDEIFRAKALGLLDILTVIPSLRLTADFIFQKCDTIMPRYYTIASSSAAFPEDLVVAVSLSRYEVGLPDGTITRDGLVSGYLEEIFHRQKAGDTSQQTSMVFVKESNFVMPDNNSTPIIMVGPGTGLVPFMGFMQEREKKRTDEPETTELGPAHLYFGCRQHDNDFIYRDEMASMKDKGIISELNLAFSREPDTPKTYVQDLLAQHKHAVREILVEQQGQFFICGATSMGKAVETLLKETLTAEEFQKMQAEKRMKVELWSA